MVAEEQCEQVGWKATYNTVECGEAGMKPGNVARWVEQGFNSADTLNNLGGSLEPGIGLLACPTELEHRLRSRGDRAPQDEKTIPHGRLGIAPSVLALFY